MDIEDVKGLSTDARQLFDWMIAAFTGDVNEALSDAKRHGAEISEWTHERLRKAHVELKNRGVLTADAPALKPASRVQGHATKKKSARQLDAEIAHALTKKTTSAISPGETPAQHKRLTKAQIKKLMAVCRMAVMAARPAYGAMKDADAEDAINGVLRAHGLTGWGAQGGDGEHVEVWNHITGDGGPEFSIALPEAE